MNVNVLTVCSRGAPGAALRRARMGKKGVSAAEKRQKMIDMFQAESNVFTKKEVEKLAPRTGIVSGAVEAVLRELINDDIVHEGKLSGTLFYWSFPGWVVPRAPRFPAAQPRESHSGTARMLSLSLCSEVAMKKRAELASFQAKAGQLEQQVRSRFVQPRRPLCPVPQRASALLSPLVLGFHAARCHRRRAS